MDAYGNHRPGRQARPLRSARWGSVLVLLSAGCGGVPSEPVDEEVCGEYALTAYGLGFDQEKTDSTKYPGIETFWDSSIGHLELGPEETLGPSVPIASFWMDFAPACLNAATGELSTECGANFFFYSIGNPSGNLGAQDAYSYSPAGGSSAIERFGIDRNGVEFIEGYAEVIFDRNQPAIGEVPPVQILVAANFTAVDLRGRPCPVG